MKDKLLRVDGFAQSGFDLKSCDGSFAHRFIEEFEACFAISLCVIHSSVGIAQEIFRGVIWGAKSNSDAGGGRDMPALQVEGLAKSFKNARGDNRRIGLVPHMGEENRKLVSAHPRHDRLRPRAG